MKKRILKIAGIAAAVILLLALSAGLAVYAMLRGSLPHVDGHLAVAGLSAPVTIERDALGIPTIRAANRLDLAFATGFVHGQERFFQMDLLRRNSAGRRSSCAAHGRGEVWKVSLRPSVACGRWRSHCGRRACGN